MTKKDRKEFGMALSKENRDTWIDLMVEFGMHCAEKKLWTEYFTYGGIGAFISTDYRIINYEALRRNIEKYTKISDNKHNDVGALVWAFLKKCQKDEKEDISKNKKNNIDFRKRHKAVDVLSRFDFDLSTRDRLAVMNFFDFSSFTPMYKLLYNRIGKFEIDKNSKDIEFEKKHAVKLFHDVL
ncbi:MAG: hypothetical protein IKL33_00215, partial [Alphaproteobacteria bacterium]|nr:hypothetical protein [Alphaproteobacteria bacterium]